MTESFRPIISSQAELQRVWRHLIRPLGFRRHSLWLLLIDREDRPTQVLTEVADLPESPGDDVSAGLERLFAHFETEPGDRWALLVSRPGSHPTDGADRAWAGALYGLCRQQAIPHDVVHLATDVDIVPIPLDDVTDYVRAS